MPTQKQPFLNRLTHFRKLANITHTLSTAVWLAADSAGGVWQLSDVQIEVSGRADAQQKLYLI